MSARNTHVGTRLVVDIAGHCARDARAENTATVVENDRPALPKQSVRYVVGKTAGV